MKSMGKNVEEGILGMWYNYNLGFLASTKQHIYLPELANERIYEAFYVRT